MYASIENKSRFKSDRLYNCNIRSIIVVRVIRNPLFLINVLITPNARTYIRRKMIPKLKYCTEYVATRRQMK